MKTSLVIFLIFSFTFIFNISANAGCYSGPCVRAIYGAKCGPGGCADINCEEGESPCTCTDPGWRWDDCMGRDVYCAAFGNVGGINS